MIIRQGRRAAIRPGLPMWTLQQVDRYLGYAGRDTSLFGEAAPQIAAARP
jgi:hypothetical protein